MLYVKFVFHMPCKKCLLWCQFTEPKMCAYWSLRVSLHQFIFLAILHKLYFACWRVLGAADLGLVLSEALCRGGKGIQDDVSPFCAPQII